MNESFHLGDFADIILGYPFESEKFNTEGQGVCLVRGMNVTEQALRFGSDARYWSHDISGLDKYLLKTNDIVIGMDGSKVGRNFSIVREENLPLLLVQRVACVRAKNEALQPFLWAMISSQRFVDYIDTVKTGSSIFHISGEQIANFPLPIFSDDEMMAIGQCIWSIDAKIANNTAICSNLEAMAKLLYDYWFVQFDFPDENGKPYKSSGGKMVWNDELKREIPAEWNVKALHELCSVISGYPFDSRTYNTNGKYHVLTIKNIQDGYIDPLTDSSVMAIPTDIPKDDILSVGSILMSLTGNVGRVGILCGDNYLLNQRASLIKPKTQSIKWYLYKLFRNEAVFTQIQRVATGTSQKNVSPTDIGNIIIPFSMIYASKYSELMQDTFENIKKNNIENQQLASLRDFLLPMLMNGQVKVC